MPHLSRRCLGPLGLLGLSRWSHFLFDQTPGQLKDWWQWSDFFSAGIVFLALPTRGNLYYISRGMQQHEALFMVTEARLNFSVSCSSSAGLFEKPSFEVYMGSNIATNSVDIAIVLSIT